MTQSAAPPALVYFSPSGRPASSSVREFVEKAFRVVGRPIEWHGKGADEIGIDSRSGEILVRIDPRTLTANISSIVFASTSPTVA